MPASLAVRWSFTILLGITVLLPAAALAGPDPLVGQWRYSNGSTIEFTSDGFMIIKSAAGATNNKMRYWTEDGSTLVMMQEDDETMTTGYQISANGKRLVLDAMGEGKKRLPDTLERVQ